VGDLSFGLAVAAVVLEEKTEVGGQGVELLGGFYPFEQVAQHVLEAIAIEEGCFC
jgi:hypothetical protein